MKIRCLDEMAQGDEVSGVMGQGDSSFETGVSDGVCQGDKLLGTGVSDGMGQGMKFQV